MIVAAKLRHTKKQNNSSTHSDSPGKIGKSFRGVAQLVEQRSPKPCVAGSNPVTPADEYIIRGYYHLYFTSRSVLLSKSMAEEQSNIWN